MPYYFDKITVLTDDKQSLQYFASGVGYAPERWKFDSFQFRIHTIIPNLIAFRQDLWHSLASALH